MAGKKCFSQMSTEWRAHSTSRQPSSSRRTSQKRTEKITTIQETVKPTPANHDPAWPEASPVLHPPSPHAGGTVTGAESNTCLTKSLNAEV
ncbi:hypothetical protein E2C01_003870 [Portunus trituberculatus]|uniref:Uncharacterized protein n=1 Tax=Portunus trituberculatus TaxID=210409 RepID=A0A5B7CP05_PORTR|nr:hypothetical protein [Portunus trituberculatus]